MDSVTLQLRLAEAEEAYHQLMTGRSVVMIRDSNGEQIQYSNASASKLAQYITTLRSQLGLPGGASAPMRAWMGR